MLLSCVKPVIIWTQQQKILRTRLRRSLRISTKSVHNWTPLLCDVECWFDFPEFCSPRHTAIRHGVFHEQNSTGSRSVHFQNICLESKSRPAKAVHEAQPSISASSKAQVPLPVVSTIQTDANLAKEAASSVGKSSVQSPDDLQA